MITKFCEHFANMCVYGINFSEQVEDNKTALTAPIDFGRGFLAPFTFGLTLIGGPCTVNNSKGSTIKLVNEMSESNSKLGEKDNWLSDRIKANIEVPSKEYCRVM